MQSIFDENIWRNFHTKFCEDDPRHILSKSSNFDAYKNKWNEYFATSSKLCGGDKKQLAWIQSWNKESHQQKREPITDFWGVYGEILAGFYLKEKLKLDISWVSEKPRQHASTPDIEGLYNKYKIFFEIQVLANAQGIDPETTSGCMPTFARYITTNVQKKLNNYQINFRFKYFIDFI